MLKKSGKVLLAYVIGIVVSMFLAVPLSPFFGNNLKLFSVITSIVTLGLVYAEMWKLGKYDALRKANKPLNAMGYIGLYAIMTTIVEIIVIIAKPAKDFTIWGIIPAVWYFPFNFFSDSKNFWVIYLCVSILTIDISMLAKYLLHEKTELIKRRQNTKKKSNKSKNNIAKKTKKKLNESLRSAFIFVENYIKFKIKGMLASARIWETKASFAPVRQSSPISFGKTIVLRPLGIAHNITAERTRVTSSVKSFSVPSTKSGITKSLKILTMYILMSVISSFTLNSAIVIPARSMLIGAIQLADLFTSVSAISGSLIAVTPKKTPIAKAMRMGLKAFLKDNFVFVSILYPNV